MSEELKKYYGTAKFEVIKTDVVVTSSIDVVGAAGYVFGEVTDTFAHNLGFVPTVLAFQEEGAFKLLLPHVAARSSGSSTGIWDAFSASADETNLYITQRKLTFGIGSSGSPLTIRYYLLRQVSK